MKFISYANRGIEYLFYSLFFLVPLVFAPNTSELFEFNKMWLTFGITITIGFLWFSKMILLKRLVFRRSIFDIVILLFLISQVISTILSIDPHISLWGYYSRWNGGLLSTITYIFLYYAFISNFFNTSDSKQINKSGQSLEKKGFFDSNPDGTTMIKRSLIVSLISGFLVVVWALPSHFGYDPTCLIFRGTLDVSCWTSDFQPRVRIFGPLGQPDWLAGYLGVLLPIAGAFALNELRKKKDLLNPLLLFYSTLFFLFYLALLYSGSRSGIGASLISLLVFFGGYTILNRKNLEVVKNKFTLIFVLIAFLITLSAGVELPNGKRLSLDNFAKSFNKTTNQAQSEQKQPEVSLDIPTSNIPLGGSSSLQIRSIVWKGGLAAWRANPIFGTGVETYAFAYYKHRPVEHNNVSEWNFLYNKAHNEYLNYLATTGAFGLFSYLSFVGLFLIIAVANLLKIKVKSIKYVGNLSAQDKWDQKDPLLLALLASFLSILIINFFGFSVVILNIYLFLIPAFVLILLNLISFVEEPPLPKIPHVSYGQWAGIAGLTVTLLFMLGMLMRFWIADTKYALGLNYNQAGDHQTAYPLLQEALKLRQEPVFQNEAAINNAELATALAAQGASESATIIQQLATQSLDTSDKLTKDYPYNVVFWKTRVRILYTLARFEPSFYPQALAAIQRTAELAPTDASILYNLGVLYGQNGNSKKAVETLEKTVRERPHYTDAHFALALFYHDLGVDQNGKIIDATFQQKAIDKMKYILENLSPDNGQAKEYLESWLKEK